VLSQPVGHWPYLYLFSTCVHGDMDIKSLLSENQLVLPGSFYVMWVIGDVPGATELSGSSYIQGFIRNLGQVIKYVLNS
jgi:hypothetical protein